MDQDELCLITLNDDENSDSEFDQKYADFCNATALCELEMNSPDCNGIVPWSDDHCPILSITIICFVFIYFVYVLL